MAIQEVRNNIIDGLEDEYTPNQIRFIDDRLEEIAGDENMSLEYLDYYCTANYIYSFAVVIC